VLTFQNLCKTGKNFASALKINLTQLTTRTWLRPETGFVQLMRFLPCHKNG
jgi:hypothetical protein